MTTEQQEKQQPSPPPAATDEGGNDANKKTKKKKRVIVPQPCPPLVTLGFMVVKHAALGVVGAAASDVEISLLQATYLKEGCNSGKFSIGLGKKLGTKCELDLEESTEFRTKLLQAIQQEANVIVEENMPIVQAQCTKQQAIDLYGESILDGSLKKMKSDQLLKLAYIEHLGIHACKVGDVVVSSTSGGDGDGGVQRIVLDFEISQVNSGKKAKKAELVLKFKVDSSSSTKNDDLPIIQEAPTMDAFPELQPSLTNGKVRLAGGIKLLQQQVAAKEEEANAKEEQAKAAAKEVAKQQQQEVPTKEMKVTMETVEGKVDYNKLVEQFGSKLITPSLKQQLEQATVGSGRVPRLHRFLRRDIFFSHRDLEKLLQQINHNNHNSSSLEKNTMYLYTGRGPSSQSMHLGHLIPFLFTKWLQDALGCPLVIQMTDDEKFLFKGTYQDGIGDDLLKFQQLGMENARDIIACGFDFHKTFLFSDLDYVGRMYPNICRIWKAVTTNTSQGIFGFEGTDNIGKVAFPAIQAAPSFASSFPTVLGGNSNTSMSCLIPCAIDQDPYFRMTRDVAHKLVPKDHPLQGKPALLHSKFFPPLQGMEGKMSSSNENSAIFLTDSAEDIARKIKQHAFSGGRDTKELQQELGADLEVDVPYQWLRFFLEDDLLLTRVQQEYGSGQGEYWSTHKVKELLIQVLQKLVAQHQERRAKVTDEEVKKWMTERCIV